MAVKTLLKLYIQKVQFNFDCMQIKGNLSAAELAQNNFFLTHKSAHY